MTRRCVIAGTTLICLALMLAWLFGLQLVVERVSAIYSIIEGTNVPINFWGRVVDQDGRPMEEVAVIYSRTTEHSSFFGVAWANSRSHIRSTKTNADGLFSITNLKGHYLTIENLKKSGFGTPERFSPARASYDFFGSGPSGKFKSDKAHPVEFVMLDESVAEPLVAHGGKFGNLVRLPADGLPVRWNLWTGESDPRGDLQVTFKREPSTLDFGDLPKSWEARIEVIGGGIVEATPEEPIWRAPKEGYLNGTEYPKVEQRRGDPSRAFYVRTADGKHGRLEVELFQNDGGPDVRGLIKALMNPKAGSRSLAR